MFVPAQQTRASSGRLSADEVHQRFHRGGVGNVERVDGQQPRGQPTSTEALPGQLRPPGYGVDAGAGVDQGRRRGQADPAGRAGDEHHPTGERPRLDRPGLDRPRADRGGLGAHCGPPGPGCSTTFINPGAPPYSRSNHPAPSESGATALISGPTSTRPEASRSMDSGYSPEEAQQP